MVIYKAYAVQNAFSTKLAPLGFNMFDMLVVDLMHELELGIWKAVFIHLLRILDCQNEGRKHELDRRQVSLKPRKPGTNIALGFERFLLSGRMG
jgi:hypothetical protein